MTIEWQNSASVSLLGEWIGQQTNRLAFR